MSFAEACWTGQEDRVAALLEEAGRDGAYDLVNQATDGETPLHLAAFQGHAAVLEALLEANARPDVTTSLGVTALHLAVQHGHTACVKVLLARGADPCVKQPDGRTPLCSARHLGASDAIVRTLKAHIVREELGGPPSPPRVRSLSRYVHACTLDGGAVLLVGTRATPTTVTLDTPLSLSPALFTNEPTVECQWPATAVKLRMTPHVRDNDTPLKPRLVVARLEELPLTITGLRPSTKYLVDIAAANTIGAGSYSSIMDPNLVAVRTTSRFAWFVRRYLRRLGLGRFPPKPYGKRPQAWPQLAASGPSLALKQAMLRDLLRVTEALFTLELSTGPSDDSVVRLPTLAREVAAYLLVPCVQGAWAAARDSLGGCSPSRMRARAKQTALHLAEQLAALARVLLPAAPTALLSLAFASSDPRTVEGPSQAHVTLASRAAVEHAASPAGAATLAVDLVELLWCRAAQGELRGRAPEERPGLWTDDPALAATAAFFHETEWSAKAALTSGRLQVRSSSDRLEGTRSTKVHPGQALFDPFASRAAVLAELQTRRWAPPNGPPPHAHPRRPKARAEWTARGVGQDATLPLTTELRALRRELAWWTEPQLAQQHFVARMSQQLPLPTRSNQLPDTASSPQLLPQASDSEEETVESRATGASVVFTGPADAAGPGTTTEAAATGVAAVGAKVGTAAAAAADVGATTIAEATAEAGAATTARVEAGAEAAVVAAPEDQSSLIQPAPKDTIVMAPSSQEATAEPTNDDLPANASIKLQPRRPEGRAGSSNTSRPGLASLCKANQMAADATPNFSDNASIKLQPGPSHARAESLNASMPGLSSLAGGGKGATDTTPNFSGNASVKLQPQRPEARAESLNASMPGLSSAGGGNMAADATPNFSDNASIKLQPGPSHAQAESLNASMPGLSSLAGGGKRATNIPANDADNASGGLRAFTPSTRPRRPRRPR